MAGNDDDIERLLREVNALNAQADAALGGDDASGKQVAKRRSSDPEPTTSSDDSSGASPAVVRALVISGGATAVVSVVFLLLAVLPGFATPGLSDILAIFLASLLVATVYSVIGRRRS